MREYAEMILQILSESSDDFVYIGDCRNGTLHYSNAMVGMFSLPKEVVLNPLSYWKKIVHPEDWGKFYHFNKLIEQNEADEHLIEFRAKKRDGEYIWLKCKGKMRRDKAGKPLFLVGVLSLLGQQNKIDPLTQLPTYEEFIFAIDQKVQNILITSMAVMMIDIDEFHFVNEIYGSEAGDEVLKIFAHTIEGILPNRASLYRLEKDKMGIILENFSQPDVENLYTKIKTLFKGKKYQCQKLELEISAGCCMYPEDGKWQEELYRCANYALQEAKERGKNRLVFFSKDILEVKKRRLELLYQLNESIKQQYDGFYLKYQPQIQPEEGKITGVEALLRWKNPSGEVVSPAEFIPLLEEYGLIYEVGLWVFRRVFQEVRTWLSLDSNFSISINVSAVQLHEDSFLSDLYKIIEEEQFPCENLVIELTESYAIKNTDLLQNIFHQMRERKIRVALDDFGTGYCSLSILKNFPVDIVKIDRAFVKDIVQSKFDAKFISLVTDICHTASISVYLEGVERSEEYEMLKDIPLDTIQGFYFGRPMEKEEITELIKLWASKKNV